jgi:hypothetical protein
MDDKRQDREINEGETVERKETGQRNEILSDRT